MMTVAFRDDFNSADSDKWYQYPVDISNYGSLSDHIENGKVVVGDPVNGASFISIVYKKAGMPDFPTGNQKVSISNQIILHRPDPIFSWDGGETSALLALGGFGTAAYGFFMQASSGDTLTYHLWYGTPAGGPYTGYLGAYVSNTAPTDVELLLKIVVDAVNVVLYANGEQVFKEAHGFASWEDFYQGYTFLYDEGYVLYQAEIQAITPNTIAMDWFQIESESPSVHEDVPSDLKIHYNALRKLAPVTFDGDWDTMLKAEGEFLDAALSFIKEKSKENYPDTAVEDQTLWRWEKMLGLARGTASNQERWGDIKSRLRVAADLSRPYAESLARGCGYNIGGPGTPEPYCRFVADAHLPFRVGYSKIGDALWFQDAGNSQWTIDCIGTGVESDLRLQKVLNSRCAAWREYVFINE